jgi:hypothetical protein
MEIHPPIPSARANALTFSSWQQPIKAPLDSREQEFSDPVLDVGRARYEPRDDLARYYRDDCRHRNPVNRSGGVVSASSKKDAARVEQALLKRR